MNRPAQWTRRLLTYARYLCVALTAALWPALRAQSSPNDSLAALSIQSTSSPTGTLNLFFTVESGTKQIFVRVVGPTLADFGITTAASSTSLRVLNATTGSVVGSNTGWGTAPESDQIATLNQKLAFPLPAGSVDSALLVSCAPGTYILQAAGFPGVSGTVLAAVYDTGDSGRINYLGVLGAGPISADFTPVGDPSVQVLIRAVSPSLHQAGAGSSSVSLELFNNSSTPVTGGIASIPSVSAALGLFPLDGTNAESNTIYTLSSSTYQATLSGLTGSELGLLDVTLVDAQRSNLPPAILYQQTVNGTIARGSALTLSVTANGQPQPSYQWQKNGVNIPGATTSVFAIPAVQATDSGTYTVQVSNSAGTASALASTVTVPSDISITTQPAAQTAVPGSSVTFTTVATGTAPLAYQWYFNNSPIAGATSSSLTLSDIGSAQAGLYDVVISDSTGSTTSNSVALSVPVARLTNMSVRAFVGTGNQALTVGYVVGGTGVSGSIPLLLRATGPALQGFGVAGVLADPELTVDTQSGTTIAFNDNWGANAAAITAADSAVGAFALTDPSSLDSGLTTTLAAGNYTAQVSGVGGSTGIALAEIYDTNLNYTTANTRLINVSAKTQVGTGGAVLVEGFVISGNAPETVLLRGIGPTLTQFGVAGALQNPTLTLFNAQQTAIQSNTVWGGDPALAAAFTSTGAFMLPTASHDSALLVTLQPGSYSAQISSSDGSTGIGLIEVYEVK